MADNKIRLLVCGGGNGAHVLAGLASLQDDIDVRVLTLYADEADRWNATVKQNGPIQLEIHDHTKPVEVKTSRDITISKDPNDVVPGCDIIAFVVPAFAHEQYFEAVKPHINNPVVLFSTPGASGFEFQAISVLGPKTKFMTIFSFESLPWICRIKEFGRCVEIMGFKETMGGAYMRGPNGFHLDNALKKIQHCVGEHPILSCHGHLIGMTLEATNQYIHPAISWGQWHDWDEDPVAKKPLFYQGVNEAGAAMMSSISSEALQIAQSIMDKHPEVDLNQVKHIHQWYKDTYQDEIADPSTLYACLKTNRGYAGLNHPMKETDDGMYVPDFTYRYYTEDIPCGLLVVKGIGEIVGLKTPNIDKIITWAQEKMQKEYLVNGKLTGKDIQSTRCPQKFEMTTVTELLGMHHH